MALRAPSGRYGAAGIGLLAALVLPGGAAAAPGRGYEMVSPVEKQGYDLVAGPSFGVFPKASESGQEIIYSSIGAFSDAPSNLFQTFFLGKREGDPLAWASRAISPVQLVVPEAFNQRNVFAHSDDLAKSVVGSTAALAPGAREGAGNLYVRANATGTFTLIATSPFPSFVGVVTGAANPVAASTSDLNALLFTASAVLAPGAIEGANNTYRWDGSEVELVSRLPGGAPTEAFGLAVTADGFTAFYRSDLTNAIYMKRAGEDPVLVSVSVRPGDPQSPAFSEFQALSRDGRYLYFTSSERLTPDATAGGVGTHDLYRYTVEDGRLEDLTTQDPDGGQAEIQGFAGTSYDGETAYFFARGELAPGAVDGEKNLYRWSRSDGIRTIGKRSASGLDTVQQMAQVSPSGEYLAFRSLARLTAYDNMSEACSSVPGVEDECGEVYRYSEASGMQCVSCASTGVRARGHATLGGQLSVAPTFFPGYTVRSVADDGTVYFNTFDSLVPADTNGRGDAYVRRGSGAEILSTGKSADDSWFADSSVSGDDVFVFTRERLVSVDIDNYMDLYDARVGGGIPSQNPPTPPAPCAAPGECRGEGTSQPPLSPAQSETFSSSGNVDETIPQAPATLRVLSAARSGRAVVLRIRLSRSGTLTVRGSRLRTSTRRVTAGTRTVRVSLTRAGVKRLNATGALTVRATLTLRVEGARARAASAVVRFRTGRRSSRAGRANRGNR